MSKPTVQELLSYIDGLKSGYYVKLSFRQEDEILDALHDLIKNMIVSKEFIYKWQTYFQKCTAEGYSPNSWQLSDMLRELGHEVEKT